MFAKGFAIGPDRDTIQPLRNSEVARTFQTATEFRLPVILSSLIHYNQITAEKGLVILCCVYQHCFPIIYYWNTTFIHLLRISFNLLTRSIDILNPVGLTDLDLETFVVTSRQREFFKTRSTREFKPNALTDLELRSIIILDPDLKIILDFNQSVSMCAQRDAKSTSMYPNATLGLMPFVKPAHKRQAAKKSKVDKADLMKAKASDMKTYKVTLRDRNGFTYTYIIQADPTSKNNPVLCASTVAAPKNLVGGAAAANKHFACSLPNMQRVLDTPESRRHLSCLGLATPQEDLTKVGEGEKKGIFNSLIGFIKKLKTKSSSASSSSSSSLSSSSSSLNSVKSGKSHTSASSGLKSKRKPKPNLPKKRQRKISAMSNLDPIQESPEEDEDTDSDSYTHDSSDLNLSES